MWSITPEIAEAEDSATRRSYLARQVVDPEGFRARIAELYANPEAEAVDVVELKDGRVFQRSSRPYRVGTAIVGRVWCYRDVTEQRRAAAALEAARDTAEAANRAKSSILANVSHELRTPLNAILGYSEMVEEEVRLQGLPNAVADLERVRGAGRHLLALINDLLDLSKIEAGRMDLDLETFPLAGLLEEAVATTRPLLAGKDVFLDVWAPPDPGELHADLRKVRQVLLNLLSNAAKFTTEGTITLEAAALLRDGEEWVALTVRDTGVGISHDQQRHLFVPFSQVDSSTTRAHGGTGLGLAISRRFCQMMGGDIFVESEPGHGSSFTVLLPRVAGSAPPSGSSLSEGGFRLPG